KQVLSGGGFTVLVSQPLKEVTGPTATYNAGSVLFIWIPPNNPSKNVFTMTVGGARVSVTAGEGFGSATTADTGTGTSETPVASDVSGAGIGSSVPTSGDLSVGGGDLGTSVPGTAATGTNGRTGAV